MDSIDVMRKPYSRMIRRHSCLALLCVLAFSQCTSPATPVKMAGTKVPTEWIEKVRTYDKQDTLLLLKQFEGFLAADTIDDAKGSPHSGKNVLDDRPTGSIRPVFVNLDDDPAKELVGIFNYGREYQNLAVFKLIGNSWYLLYHESFYDFYNASELKVANSASPNKVFYINCLYERGSGVYRDAYRFFKLIDNKVYPCLEIPKMAHIYGWGLCLNQEDSTRFLIDSARADNIMVAYCYNFFPGYEYNTPKSQQVDMSFAKGEKIVWYKWNKNTFTYEPALSNKPDEMSKDKIANLSRFGDDSLFIKAFAYEIDEIFKTASPKQKQCLERYLEFVKSKK